MVGLPFSPKLFRGSYIIPVAKTAIKKIAALILSKKSLFISISLPSCLAWNAVSMFGLVLVAATRICQINYSCGYVGLFILHFLPLLKKTEDFSVFISLEDGHLNWLGRSNPNSNRLPDFSVTTPRCYKNVYRNSFFSHTTTLWNSLPVEYFCLTYDLNDCKFKVNRYLLSLVYLYVFHLFLPLFLLTFCRVYSALQGVNLKQKNQQ